MTEDAARAEMTKLVKEYGEAFDALIGAFIAGIERNTTDDLVLTSAIALTIIGDEKVTRDKLAGLVAVAGMRCARAIHEGDWA